MRICKDCGNIQGDDNTGIDGYCEKCGSEDLEQIKEKSDQDSQVEVANEILSKWGL